METGVLGSINSFTNIQVQVQFLKQNCGAGKAPPSSAGICICLNSKSPRAPHQGPHIARVPRPQLYRPFFLHIDFLNICMCNIIHTASIYINVHTFLE